MKIIFLRENSLQICSILLPIIRCFIIHKRIIQSPHIRYSQYMMKNRSTKKNKLSQKSLIPILLKVRVLLIRNLDLIDNNI